MKINKWIHVHCSDGSGLAPWPEGAYTCTCTKDRREDGYSVDWLGWALTEKIPALRKWLYPAVRTGEGAPGAPGMLMLMLRF